MDATTTLQTIQTWPLNEQLDFLFRAWDQLIDRNHEHELTEELKVELGKHLDAYPVRHDLRVTRYDHRWFHKSQYCR